VITPEDRASPTQGAGTYFVIYVCILVIAALQFVIAYSNLSTSQMLVRMLCLAFVEAAMAVLFFMHLWSEKRYFIISVGVVTIFVLFALQYSWSDSFRLITCGGKCS